MKKIIFAVIILISVCIVLNIVIKRNDEKVIHVENSIPPDWESFNQINLINTTGQSTKMPKLSNKHGIIFFYNPECESCIIKLYELKNTAVDPASWQIVLISSRIRQKETATLIRKVGLDKEEFINAFLADETELTNLYSIQGVPQVLLYNEKGRIIKILPEKEIDFEILSKKMEIAENPE